MKPKLVAIEESEWLIYAVLPHKGDGMTLKEISQLVENIPLEGYWGVKFLSPMKVENALEKLCKKGLAEGVETPEGKRYRRKPCVFKLPIKVCQHCGSPFLARNMKRKFCSDSCRVKHHLRFCDKCRAKAMQHLDEFVKHKIQRLECDFESVDEGFQFDPDIFPPMKVSFDFDDDDPFNIFRKKPRDNKEGGENEDE